jgi:hypothetical protein
MKSKAELKNRSKVDVWKSRLEMEDLLEILFFYAGTGWDSAICSNNQSIADASAETSRFINECDKDKELMLAFFRSLHDMKGFKYTQEIFSDTGIEDRFPILTSHLMLSVYS